MKILFLLLGLGFGAVEFFLTAQIAQKALAAQRFLAFLLLKMLSYAAVLAAVFLLPQTQWILPCGIGAGAGILLCAPLMLLRARRANSADPSTDKAEKR